MAAGRSSYHAGVHAGLPQQVHQTVAGQARAASMRSRSARGTASGCRSGDRSPVTAPLLISTRAVFVVGFVAPLLADADQAVGGGRARRRDRVNWPGVPRDTDQVRVVACHVLLDCVIEWFPWVTFVIGRGEGRQRAQACACALYRRGAKLASSDRVLNAKVNPESRKSI